MSHTIETSSDGYLYESVGVYDSDGRLHDTRGPAVLNYDNRSGSARLHEAAYYQHGALHREGGPAVVYCSPYETLSRQEWWRNGQHQGTVRGDLCSTICAMLSENTDE